MAASRAGSVLSGRVLGLCALILAIGGAMSWMNPAFLTVSNLLDVLCACAPALIVGCGMTLVVVAGEIDISVGSMMGALAAALGLLGSPRHTGWPAPLVMAVVIALGTAAGAINGWLVAFLRIPSIIATLAMLSLLRGVADLLLAGQWITDLSPDLRALGTGAWLGVPIPIWIAGVVAASTWVFARRAAMGRYVYAIGDDAAAAAFAGLSTRRLRLFVFALTGALTGVAALVSLRQMSVVESGIGRGFELTVVTAVVVGGTSIRGGVGNIPGTALAVVVLGVVPTILVFLRAGDMTVYWQGAIQGAFILGAVLLDHRRRVPRAGPRDRGANQRGSP